MRVFTYNEKIDCYQKKILSRIRQLMNGEISHQLQEAGMNYKKAFGVSMVHLRQLAAGYDQDNDLAERLWFRNIRETMILATMLAQPDKLSDDKILGWGVQINNIELAEQIAFNMVGRKKDLCGIVEKWIFDECIYLRYSALMSLGWHFRFVGNDMSQFIKDNLSYFNVLASSKLLLRAVTHCLKMAGCHNTELVSSITGLAEDWCKAEDGLLQRAGLDILDEINSKK